MGSTHTRLPDTVRQKAEEIRDEYDYSSLGEAVRHMCRAERGFDV